jgi:hypothetical protein
MADEVRSFAGTELFLPYSTKRQRRPRLALVRRIIADTAAASR